MADPQPNKRAQPGSVWWHMVATGAVDFLRVEGVIPVPDGLGGPGAYWIHADTCTVDPVGVCERVRKITLSPWQLNRYTLGGVWPRGQQVPVDVHGRARIVDHITALTSTCPTPKDLSGVHICLHCLGVTTDFYMVTPEVWAQARGALYLQAERLYGEQVAVLNSLSGHLHLPCVEVLIGRRLQLADFSPVRCNDTVRWALSRENGTF